MPEYSADAFASHAAKVREKIASAAEIGEKTVSSIADAGAEAIAAAEAVSEVEAEPITDGEKDGNAAKDEKATAPESVDAGFTFDFSSADRHCMTYQPG